MHMAELNPLDLYVAANYVYDTTQFQAILFCADSFEQMFGTLREFLLRW